MNNDEIKAIVAGLRLLQLFEENGAYHDLALEETPEIMDVLDIQPLGPGHIDALCMRLNTEPPVSPDKAAIRQIDKILSTFTKDFQMALDGSWDKGDEGFEAMECQAVCARFLLHAMFDAWLKEDK